MSQALQNNEILKIINMGSFYLPSGILMVKIHVFKLFSAAMRDRNLLFEPEAEILS